ncbi:hypothetical protein ADUPG1_006700 [Aduncisulcus paluster]|uniref:Uncharacterized protein n=1 Tax=Aduncisulcus paluster TaxID=2918883 RepID=A0ABQ5KMP6_9EUKA|nr:hypothetical protein ADUPG1_006700 [Aduncisulcus paluster]
MVIQSRFMYSTTREEHERNMEEKREKEKKRYEKEMEEKLKQGKLDQKAREEREKEEKAAEEIKRKKEEEMVTSRCDEDVKRRKRRMKRLKERSIRQNRAASQANMVIQSRFMYSTTREEHERNMEEKREKEKKRYEKEMEEKLKQGKLDQKAREEREKEEKAAEEIKRKKEEEMVTSRCDPSDIDVEVSVTLSGREKKKLERKRAKEEKKDSKRKAREDKKKLKEEKAREESLRKMRERYSLAHVPSDIYSLSVPVSPLTSRKVSFGRAGDTSLKSPISTDRFDQRRSLRLSPTYLAADSHRRAKSLFSYDRKTK